MKQVGSINALEKEVNRRAGIAVKNVATIMSDKLREFLSDEYYAKYNPEIYKRTYKFLNSATYELLNGNTASIGISDDFLNYEYPAIYKSQDGAFGHWTGEDQSYMGEAGYHGNAYIYRDGHYWSEFENWCRENVVNLLTSALKKQGLNVK